ncbi:MFS transporter [Pseudonocardia yuanmonensis]|uniref:MFS transporter n=1 Tax=Pseudonocardia yuanmonensis TaxID=1095914 RepID=A0ABP8W123_9PSEU
MDLAAEPPGGRGALRLLQAAVATSSLDRFAISPLLLAIGAELGASLAESAAVASAYFLAYGLLQPVWGMLGDRIGLVRVMRIALVIAGIAGVASAFAPSVLVLALLRTVTGGCFGAVNPAGLVYVGDTWPTSVRQRALVDLAAATSFGVAVATAGAGALGDWAGWRVVLAVTALIALLLGVVLRRLPEPPRKVPSGPLKALGTVLRERWALVVLVLVFLEGAVVIGVLTYVAPAIESLGFSPTVSGVAAAGYGVGVVLFSRSVRPLVGRLSTTALAGVGGALLIAGWGIPAAAVTLPTTVAGGLLLGGAWAFLHSTLQNWATSVVPQERATTIALFAATLFLGSAAGTAVAGPAADAGAFPAVFRVTLVAAAVLAVAAPLLVARYARRPGADGHGADGPGANGTLAQ